jgi:DNA-binding transcriptional MerR regulator
MLISDFARLTGLTRDTVRFYARLGLLQPRTNGKGGRHPYRVFADRDIQAAEEIRIAQSLGMSLKEIAALNQERREGELTCERGIEVMSALLVPRLVGKSYLAGSTRASPLIFALRGRVICAAIKAIAAAIDSHAPGIARLPVSWIKYVTMAGVDPPIVVARL